MADYPLSIQTPEGSRFKGNVTSLIAPGQLGYFGVQSGHAPLISSLAAGALTVRTGTGDKFFSIGAGVLEVSKDGVVVLADNAEEAPSEDEAKAKAPELYKRLGLDD